MNKMDTRECLDSDSDVEDPAMAEVLNFASKKHHTVMLNFGDEEKLTIGTTKIKRGDIYSANKQENALLFVQNLDKISQAKQEGKAPMDMTFNEDNSTMLNTNAQNCDNVSDFSQGLQFKSKAEDDVILNVSPQKYEKPKDELFLKFFSMYTKRSVEEKKQTRQMQRFKSLETDTSPRSIFA